MTLSETLLLLAKTAEKEFPALLGQEPEVFDDRVRLVFSDGSFMEIRYPRKDKYSFHWQRGEEVYRINTAPHHRQLASFPRHIHDGSEEKEIEDFLTDLHDPPEVNLVKVLNWVQDKLKETK